MRRPRIILCVSIAANLALAVCVWFLLASLKNERAESWGAIARLRQQITELEAVKTQPAATSAPSDADQLELARLRNEVTRLRAEQRAAAVAATNAAARRSAPAAPPLEASSPPAPAVRKLTSQTQVNLPLGQTLALGGWPGAEPGERILSFITPTTDPAAPGTVLVQSHLISVPDRLLDRLGLQDLRTGESASQAAAALDPARFAALLKFAEGENGVSVLSAPRVLTGNGRAAQVAVTQAHPDGTQTGPVLNLTPTLDAAGSNVRLEVNLEFTLPAARQP